MIVLDNKLTEQYFVKMHKLVERDKLPIKQWNLIQKKLWQQLIDDNYVTKNDTKAFSAIGQYFDDFYQRTGHILDYGRLVAYVGGY